MMSNSICADFISNEGTMLLKNKSGLIKDADGYSNEGTMLLRNKSGFIQEEQNEDDDLGKTRLQTPRDSSDDSMEGEQSCCLVH